MIITDYRVKTVLRTYAKQLHKAKLARVDLQRESVPSTERVTISEEAKRRLVIDRLSQKALESTQTCNDEEVRESEEAVSSGKEEEVKETQDQEEATEG